MFIKTFILSSLFVSFLFGTNKNFVQEMNYYTSYKDALENSIEKYKPLMMVVIEKTSPWAKKLENQVLQKKEIDEIIQIGFTPLLVHHNQKNYPNEKFEIQEIPSTLFIDPLKQQVFYRINGYVHKKEFEAGLLEAKNIFYKKGDTID